MTPTVRIAPERLASVPAQNALGFVLDANPHIWRFWAHHQPEPAADWYAAGLATAGRSEARDVAPRLIRVAKQALSTLVERPDADAQGWMVLADALLRLSWRWAGEREGQLLAAAGLEALGHVEPSLWRAHADTWMAAAWDPAWRGTLRSQGTANDARDDHGLTLGHRLVAACARDGTEGRPSPTWKLLLTQWAGDGGAWSHTDGHGWSVAQRALSVLPALALFDPALAAVWTAGVDPSGSGAAHRWVNAVVKCCERKLDGGLLLSMAMATLERVLTVQGAAATTDAHGRTALAVLLRHMADLQDTAQLPPRPFLMDNLKTVLQHPRFTLAAWQDAGWRLAGLSGREVRVLRRCLVEGDRAVDEAVAHELDRDLPAATDGRNRMRL